MPKGMEKTWLWKRVPQSRFHSPTVTGVPAAEDVGPYVHLKTAMQDELLNLRHHGQPRTEEQVFTSRPLVESVLKPSAVHHATYAKRTGPRERLELGEGVTVQPTFGGDFEVRKPVRVVEEKSQSSEPASGISGKQTDNV